MSYEEIWLSAIKGLMLALSAVGGFLGLLCMVPAIFIRSSAAERLVDLGFWVIVVSVVLGLASILCDILI